MAKLSKNDRPERGIYQNGNRYWLAYQRNKKRVFVSLETDDYGTAVERAAEIRDAPELNEGHLLSGLIPRFIAYKVRQGEYSRFSAENKVYSLRLFMRHVGDVAPATVSTARAKEFYIEQRKRVSDSTAEGYMMVLRSFFKWCVEEEKVTRLNPCKGVKLISGSTTTRDCFCEPTHRDKLIDDCERQDLKFILFCGFHGGLRRNEICEARPAWFDLKRRLINILKVSPRMAKMTGLDPFDLKDREERKIPMTSEFAKFLETYPMDGDYCIAPGVRRAAAKYRYDFHRPFTEYMEEHDCTWVTPHIMRHTFASLLASEGVSLGFISNWLGDDIRTTTKHYAGFLPKHAEIEKAFRSAPKRARKSRKS
jgi:integrase